MLEKFGPLWLIILQPLSPSNSFAKKITFTSESFDGPIYGIGLPELRYPCPKRCGHWAKQKDFCRSHYNRSCRAKGAPPADLAVVEARACLTQMPFSINRNMAQVLPVKGLLSDIGDQVSSGGTNSETIQRYEVLESVESFRPPWLRKLGWDVWRDEQIRRGISRRATGHVRRFATTLTALACVCRIRSVSAGNF